MIELYPVLDITFKDLFAKLKFVPPPLTLGGQPTSDEEGGGLFPHKISHFVKLYHE